MEAIINIAKVGKCRIQEDQESWEWSQRFSFIAQTQRTVFDWS